MGSTRLAALAAPLIAACLCVPAALGAPGTAKHVRQGRAQILPFHPRSGPALGIVPPLGHLDYASGTSAPVVYHGGQVMRDVTIHTIFWAPSGYHFQGPPPGAGSSYEGLIQQFFTDVAHDSGQTTNVFSVLGQYPDGHGAGSYNISYNSASDSIDDPQPYPAAADQCASPGGIATCITDLQLEQEVNRVINARDPAGRGLRDLWVVFLPPNVDTCSSPGQCGTNAFGGYHSLSNLGHGPAIYASIPDPLIELTAGPGQDPQGNPDAEAAINVAAHEVVEAITDPQGAGWMDPNGFETGDKCETGPQIGTPLGYAANGSPYNQLINSRQYLIQTMWANTPKGCQLSSSSSQSALPLASVSLRQFSPLVGGNIGTGRAGVPVTVVLARTGVPVASASTTTGAGGGWSTALRSIAGGVAMAPGDDRDEILVHYGAHGPPLDFIQTGNGGDPFTGAGWTGWFDLDHGYAVGSRSILISPCSQTGVLGLLVGQRATSPPIEQCQPETNVSVNATGSLRAGTSLSFSSQDNRAVTIANVNGALVTLTVPLGEPGSAPDLGNGQILFLPSGFPSCSADLSSQSVRCAGLVPGARYTLTRARRRSARRADADGSGVARFGQFAGPYGIAGGDLLTLTNSARRVLSSLHVARLRVDLIGNRTVISAGRCEAGQYYGEPLQTPPVSAAIGVPGTAGSGTICPRSGRAAGLPSAGIMQSDDLSGGLTQTEVPRLESTAPVQDATLYGPFVASAQTGLPGPNGSIRFTGSRVALTITRAGSGKVVFRAANVARGVTVRHLGTGSYLAKWLVIDAAGDTRLVRTGFVEQSPAARDRGVAPGRASLGSLLRKLPAAR